MSNGARLKPIVQAVDEKVAFEGCMRMNKATVPDELLLPLGLFNERLSQTALYHATMQVAEVTYE